MITENGQHGKTETFDFLEICCQQVSERYGKSDRENWINSDYVNLSQALFRQTRVRISPNTLKRIFGKIKTDSRYYPQKATRDALAAYIGYPSWDHFVQVQERAEWHTEQNSEPVKQDETRGQSDLTIPETAAPDLRPKRNWRLPLVIGGLVLLVVLATLFVGRIEQVATPVKLVCRNPLGENPHSAVFLLQRSKRIADESGRYTILFGDGKRDYVNPYDSLYTHYYERPGRYFAILQRDGQPVDTAIVYLQTKGWTVTASMMHDTSRVYPIDVRNLFADKRRSVSALEAGHAGVDTNRTFFMEFINSQPTNIDGDNFELTTYVKSSSDRAGVRCSQVGLTVWGESSQHSFEVMKPGCMHWIAIQTSDIRKSGHRDDLSFLGADLRNGGQLTLKVIDRKALIFINNRKVYETHYTKPLHRVYGVRIQFAGIGTIDSFSLKDLKTNAVFNGSF